MTTDAAIAVINGTCHHDCPDSCGWSATVDTGRVVELRGNPDHPYSRGELCPKVNRFLDRVYSPDRILQPLRRSGPKGSGRFDPIDWDTALGEIGDRLTGVIERWGPESVLPYSSAGNQSLLATGGISTRFFYRMGATLLDRGLCGPTVGAGVAMTNGTGLGADPLTLIDSKLIVLWGTNTRLTNRHLWPTIEAARGNGARLIVIDPIRTATADAADQHIAPRPGTDVAMMLAVMHVIIADDLVDRRWVDAHTSGFGELADHVTAWTPERASAETGIDADTIVRFAREYATTRPAAIRTLIGAEHHENGAMFFRTLACLPALVGSWATRGGGLMRSVGSWQDRLVDDTAFGRPDLLRGRAPRVINMSRLGDALLNADPRVAAMIVWNANPVVTVPNSAAIVDGMARDDLFCVVHEQFMTDTARFADIVLPATTQLESVDVVPAWGHLWLGWNEPAIDPRGESVSNTELFRRLAAAMGYDDDCLFEDDLDLLRAALPDVDLDRLRAEGWMRVPFPDTPTPWSNGGFPTASGRVEFVSDRLATLGQPRLPTYVPATEGPRGPTGDRYPLQLMSTKHHVRFMNSSYSPFPKHGPAEGEPFVELTANDARARGIRSGDVVTVHNDRATLELPARISDRLTDGVVMIPWGWWRHQHRDGHVANDLTNDTLTDWGGGVAFSDTMVEITPAASPTAVTAE